MPTINRVQNIIPSEEVIGASEVDPGDEVLVENGDKRLLENGDSLLLG